MSDTVKDIQKDSSIAAPIPKFKGPTITPDNDKDGLSFTIPVVPDRYFTPSQPTRQWALIASIHRDHKPGFERMALASPGGDHFIVTRGKETVIMTHSGAFTQFIRGLHVPNGPLYIFYCLFPAGSCSSGDFSQPAEVTVEFDS